MPCLPVSNSIETTNPSELEQKLNISSEIKDREAYENRKRTTYENAWNCAEKMQSRILSTAPT